MLEGLGYSGRFCKCTGRFGRGGGLGICSGGFVSGGFCRLRGSWSCAWSTGTITTNVTLMEDVPLEGSVLEGFA